MTRLSREHTQRTTLCQGYIPVLNATFSARSSGADSTAQRGMQMRQDQVEASSPGLERTAAKRAVRKDFEGRGGTQQPTAGVRKEGAEPSTPAAEASANAEFRSHRELGTAILAAGDPVKTGCELLDKNTSEDRGAPTRLKSLQTFADWAVEDPG